MRWPPEPVFPAPVLSEVILAVMQSKNTMQHHDAERVARLALAAAAKALPNLPADALRALGLTRT